MRLRRENALVVEPPESATFELPEDLSARRLLGHGQLRSLVVGTATVAGLMAVYASTGLGPSFAWWGRAVVLLVTVVYVVVISFKLLLVVAAPDDGGWDEARLAAAGLPEAVLPRYTILVPLHREARVLPELVARLSALEYPRELLQILFLVEVDDTETRAVLAAMELKEPFETVVVPPNGPQTKPRACNFGLARAHG